MRQPLRQRSCARWRTRCCARPARRVHRTWRATSPARSSPPTTSCWPRPRACRSTSSAPDLAGRAMTDAAPRSRRRRRVPAQRPLPRQHPRRRSHVLVPVFVDGPSTSSPPSPRRTRPTSATPSRPPTCRSRSDVYAEGALIFPCVRVQRDYSDVDDIIRMCPTRIRVPDQWYGDYLAMVGAARIGERRLDDLVANVRRSTRSATSSPSGSTTPSARMAHAIRQMPAGTVTGRGRARPASATSRPTGSRSTSR